MENKEVIDRLVEYFLTQDPAIVARMFANAIVDLNRVYHIDQLSDSEIACLFDRMEHNREQVIKLIEDGPHGNINLKLVQS